MFKIGLVDTAVTSAQLGGKPKYIHVVIKRFGEAAKLIIIYQALQVGSFLIGWDSKEKRWIHIRFNDYLLKCFHLNLEIQNIMGEAHVKTKLTEG